jgi:hypothetical protein
VVIGLVLLNGVKVVTIEMEVVGDVVVPLAGTEVVTTVKVVVDTLAELLSSSIWF